NITTCGANTWSTVGGTQCNACPANSSTKGATGQIQCVCNDGYTTNGKFDGSTITTTQACIKTDINVSYDVNGGVGRLGGHTCPAGADCTLLTPSDIGNQMYRAGYVFIGWGDKANATTPVNPVFNTDVTLYAIWNACAAGTYKTADAALDAQCSLCADLDNSGMYPNTNSVASTSASACYMTCKDKTVSGGVAHPTDVNVYYPNVCEYKTGTSINGNTCEIVNDKCIEVSCNFDYEMIDGICHPCNRENATEYQKTGNCIVAKCRYGYHPNGQSCQSDTIECTAPNAVSASQKWDTKTGAYGICTVTKCDAGYHIVANACQPDEQTCELEHGIGWREWDEKKNDWGKCVATYCEPGYTNDPDLTNESWEQCGRCNNMYGTRGELVVSSYVQGCEIAACMHQGEHFILENNECRDICETYSDETGSRKWNGSRCVHTCNEGYTNW
ncbi:MAG: InlB B-repeat-containing protein, partial [Alphaproteobacteria bacterium]|nr:InlB B-repeat-containing protein [Alphaproteobacteria bacterium]